MNSATRRLMRSRSDSVIGGVAGGLGSYLAIDPLVVRVIFVLLALIDGIGLLAYLVMWLVMPPERQTRLAGDGSASQPHTHGSSGGWFRSATTVRQVFVEPSNRPWHTRFSAMTSEQPEPEEVPINDVQRDEPPADPEAQMRRNWLLGAILVGLGTFLAIKMLFPFLLPFVIPAALIAAGLFLITRHRSQPGQPDQHEQP